MPTKTDVYNPIWHYLNGALSLQWCGPCSPFYKVWLTDKPDVWHVAKSSDEALAGFIVLYGGDYLRVEIPVAIAV